MNVIKKNIKTVKKRTEEPKGNVKRGGRKGSSVKREPRPEEKQGRFTNFGQGVKQTLLERERWLPFLRTL